MIYRRLVTVLSPVYEQLANTALDIFAALLPSIFRVLSADRTAAETWYASNHHSAYAGNECPSKSSTVVWQDFHSLKLGYKS
jgi:hypothetical protein